VESLRDTVHEPEYWDKSQVDFANNLFLLLRCEGVDDGLVAAIGHNALDLLDTALLIGVGRCGRHDDIEREDGAED
jgi:hypothetical protein